MTNRIVLLVAVTVATFGGQGAARGVSTGAGAPCDGQWHLVPSANHSYKNGEYDSLVAVASLSASDGWAVGSGSKYPGNYFDHTLIERWDGVAWGHVHSPNTPDTESYLNGVAAVAPDDVWAVGGTDSIGPPYHALVEHWDGTSWSVFRTASAEGTLYGVAATGPDDVWAVGTDGYPGPGLIEHWEGITWTATYLSMNAVLRSVTAVGPGDVWAVGYQYNPADTDGDFTLTMHFDGASWTEFPSPNPLKVHPQDQNWLTSVSAVGSDDVWAVGRYGDHDGGPLDDTLVEHWDGVQWTQIASFDPGGSGEDDDLWAVAAVGFDDVWAVGTFGNSDPDLFALAEHWDGVSWTQVPMNPPIGRLLGVAAEPTGTGISATGDRDGPGFAVVTLAEHLCPA
jgi:hypothetical protein